MSHRTYQSDFVKFSGVIILLIILAFFSPAFAQSVSINGIINNYTPVTAIDTSSCRDKITVSSSGGFSIGDTVLIIQMKGAYIDSSNTATFGTIADYNGAGNYEFASIASIAGNQITINGKLQKPYYMPGHVQLIRVPVYNDANVSSTLLAQSWDGSTGGVLVFFVSDTLALNADIDADGKGFRGGTISNNPDGGCGNNNVNGYYYDVYQGGGSWVTGGAEKAEGIAEISSMKRAGRGTLANGGGGGNKHNTGGGGGGNYTAGGKGGNELQGCAVNGNGGLGGRAMPYNLQKVFLGGGGGCGDFNDGVGSVGVNGAGIVIIKAKTIVGNGHAIHADGLDELVQGGGIADGVGGGGAGGAIFIVAQNFSSSALTLRADGGDGGDQGLGNYYGCVGTGGGGGTGVIYVSGASLPANVTPELLPGAAGMILIPAFSCYNTTYGATDGNAAPSNYLTGLQLPYSSGTGNTYPVNNDTALCSGDQWLIDLSNYGTSFLWQDGSASPTYSISAAGLYYVTVTDSDQCTYVDSFFVSYTNPPTASILSDSVFCPGSTMILSAEEQNQIYLWNTGESVSSIMVNDTGIYWLQVSNNCGSVIDSVHIEFSPSCSPYIFIPNAFSPNGDGLNDVFHPLLSNISSYQMKIFNRWGELIFETSDPVQGWDGKYKGKPAELGVYVYLIQFSPLANPGNMHYQQSGNVTLLY